MFDSLSHHAGHGLSLLPHDRKTYEAKSKSVQAAAAALKHAVEAEGAKTISDLKAELAAAKAALAKAAAKAKAERQNAHTIGRERAQTELKEVLEDQ